MVKGDGAHERSGNCGTMGEEGSECERAGAVLIRRAMVGFFHLWKKGQHACGMIGSGNVRRELVDGA